MCLRSVAEDLLDHLRKPHRKAVIQSNLLEACVCCGSRMVWVWGVSWCVTFGFLVCLVCLRMSRLSSNLTVIITSTSLIKDVIYSLKHGLWGLKCTSGVWSALFSQNFTNGRNLFGRMRCFSLWERNRSQRRSFEYDKCFSLTAVRCHWEQF